MWRHPRYEELTGRPAPATSAAPEPSGETLAQLVRRGPDGVEQRLRIASEVYEGHPYVSIRLWSGGWPTPKGVSIRMAELPVVIAALQKALDQAEPEPTREPPPRRRQRPEGRPRWTDGGSPPPPQGHEHPTLIEAPR